MYSRLKSVIFLVFISSSSAKCRKGTNKPLVLMQYRSFAAVNQSQTDYRTPSLFSHKRLQHDCWSNWESGCSRLSMKRQKEGVPHAMGYCPRGWIFNISVLFPDQIWVWISHCQLQKACIGVLHWVIIWMEWHKPFYFSWYFTYLIFIYLFRHSNASDVLQTRDCKHDLKLSLHGPGSFIMEDSSKQTPASYL